MELNAKQRKYEVIKEAYCSLQTLVTSFLEEETSGVWDDERGDCPEEYRWLVSLDQALFILEEDF